MRCACIDIGSNTTRLLVADVVHGRLEPVVQQRSFIRLGRALAVEQALPDELVQAVAEAVARQQEVAAVAGAERLLAVATAAIRRARNRDALLAAIEQHAGVAVTVVPGEHEARLAFAGATRTLDKPPEGTVAVVDVGGMSTEIAVGTVAGGVTWARSYQIGSSALAASCRRDPPSRDDVDNIRAAARAAFTQWPIPAADHAIAVGGSAASMPTLVGPVIDPDALERALGVLTSAPADEVARLHDLAPERTQLLPAGILVLGAAAERLGRPLQIGRGGLREGVILELAAASHQ